jgi:SecD/SecF fusion protein
MQNKGAIRVFTIALFLVCIYQLSFTLVTRKVEKDAIQYASGDSALQADYLDSISSEVVYNILVRKYTYKECKEREINLGLDLKGGMNVTLEVSVVEMIRSLANYSMDTTFNQAINLAREYQKDSQEDFVTLFGRAFEDIDPNGRLAAIFSTREMRGRIDYNSTNEDVLKVITEETEGAINNSFNVLRSRIDRFGVVQPNIQRLETRGRILIELPGVKEPERVRKLLQGTASLEFWETYESSDFFTYMQEANTKLKEILDAEAALRRDETGGEPETTGEENPFLEQLSQSSQEPGEETSPGEPGDTTEEEISLLDQISGEEAATDSTALSLDEFIKENPLLGILQPYVTRNGQFVPGSRIGFAHYRDTSKINYYLQMSQIRSIFPRDVRFAWHAFPFDEGENYYWLHVLKVTGRDGRPPLDGDAVTNASVDFSQTGGSAEVVMSMDGEGAAIWGRLTRDNIGKSIAIVLDGFVYSAPTVETEIPNGRSNITGDFTYNEAEDLANVLESGKLPAPASIVQEAIVGPSLGKAAIDAGLNSFIISFFVVLLYMIFYYTRRAGLIADVALLANIFFLMGVLASLGAVLTLPGIAGIVLTMGMSVDANVLIYERIRDELAAGKGIKLAIADGYKFAMPAIIDSNLTTLLTGVILLVLGTGPIKGFATTLVIGICTSLFSAIFITRLIYEGMLTRNMKLTFVSRITENFLKGTDVKFMDKRKVLYFISAVLILISVGSLTFKGLNQGVDFIGGRTFVVRFDRPVNPQDVRESLTGVFGEMPQVITFGSEDQVRVVTKYKIEESTAETDEEVEQLLYAGLQPFLGDHVNYEEFLSDYRQSSQKVGPTIADDIKIQAVWAILASLVLMFLYIFIRFRNWQFGMGALVALVHDVLVVLGVFSIFYGVMPFSLEIDQNFIAAILTVVGYSVNDTVVVYDRIREYVGLYPNRDKKEVLDMAMNSTLSRTLNTGASTFFVLIVIFFFGGEVIRGFTFALMIGIIVGTYSSVFIATPIVFDTIMKTGTAKLLKVRRKA